MPSPIWKPIETAPEGVLVETIQADCPVIGHDATVLFRVGECWLRPGGSPYYAPSHWRPLPRTEAPDA